MFEEWRALWREETRFTSFAKEHPSIARRMLRQVAILTQALSDETGLESKFGFARTEKPRQVVIYIILSRHVRLAQLS